MLTLLCLALVQQTAVAEEITSPSATYIEYCRIHRSAKHMREFWSFYTDSMKRAWQTTGGVNYANNFGFKPGDVPAEPSAVFEKVAGTDAILQIKDLKSTNPKALWWVKLKKESSGWKIAQQFNIADATDFTHLTDAKPQAWCAEAVSAPFIQQAARGKMNGRPFLGCTASLQVESGELFITSAASDVMVIHLGPVKFKDKTKPLRLSSAIGTTPVIETVSFLGHGTFVSNLFSADDHYGLKLTMTPVNKYTWNTYISLRLPDAAKSELNGYLNMNVRAH